MIEYRCTRREWPDVYRSRASIDLIISCSNSSLVRCKFEIGRLNLAQSE